MYQSHQLNQSKLRYSALAVAMLPLIYSVHAYADDTEYMPTATLDPIIITAIYAQERGTQHIENQDIITRPTRNGTISELLTDNPNVQFSNSYNNSETAGEIAPENVSVHGERFYNNNWTIDGMSNNDNVNPGSNNGSLTSTPEGYSPWDLPAGGTQSFWINSDIIDSADVYDSNISAKYGEFTGGVIDAKLKDPDTLEQSGSVSYRTTRDDWIKFHIKGGSYDDDTGTWEESDEDTADATETFEDAQFYYYQPQFTKNIYSLNVNQPIDEKTAVMFSYNRTESDIPFHHTYLRSTTDDSEFAQWEEQKRLSETYVLKGKHELDSGDDIKVTAMYSPHESTYVKSNIKNGKFTNEGGGYRINGQWDHYFNEGRVSSYLGYKQTQNRINSEEDNYIIWRNSDGIVDWCSNSRCTTAMQGGYGDWETGNKTITLKQDYMFDPMMWGKTEHSVNMGVEGNFAEAHYERENPTSLYNAGSTRNLGSDTNGDCAGDEACTVSNGTAYFAKSRTLYSPSDITVNNNHFSSYVEDKINVGNLEVTPGMRIQRDAFLGNTDIAPRFSLSYDVFGDDNTQVFGGANRYYAGSMLAFKLREAVSCARVTQTRDSLDDDWEDSRSIACSSGLSYQQPNNLDTPYSDEINLGVQQKFGNTQWTVKWVNRHAQDQFARTSFDEDGDERSDYRILNNNGESKADTFSLEAQLLNPLEFKHATVGISGGANYTESESNFSYYDDSLDDDELNQKVIVNGELLDVNETPAMDYNNPWRAFVNINTEVPAWNMNWAQTLNYTNGYTYWDDESVDCSDGTESACGSYTGEATKYSEYEFDDAVTLDWRFNFDIPLKDEKSLNFNVDVLNVLDEVAESSDGRGSGVTYSTGRQFWAGVKYKW